MFSQIAVLRCSRCSWTQELLHRPVLRQLDEHASRASSVHAWCADQARVVLAERVPSPEDLIQERATIAEVRASADDDDLVEVPTLEWLDEQIRWRAQRVEPAKCLECSGIRISPERSRPGEPSPGIEHPGCGGELRATELLYTSGEPPPIVIDAEGHPLGLRPRGRRHSQ